MNCRHVQSLLSLAVGQDAADPTAEESIRVHLASCAVCSQVQRNLEAAHLALLESRTQPRLRRGLWPQVAACIADWERRPQFARFNVWVPSCAAVAACVLLVSVAVLEVDETHRWLPSVVMDRPEQRNLFVTDPDFASDRGQVISAEDISRWRQQDSKSSRLQQATRQFPQWQQTWPQD